MSDALTPERLAEVREVVRRIAYFDPNAGSRLTDLLAHVDHLTADNARLRAELEICERASLGNAQAHMAAHAEVKRLRAGIKSLHRPALPVFSWRDGLRFDEPCPECHGKAGVHSCGCWSDEDAEFACFECSRPSSGYLRRDTPWPCATAALLDPPKENDR